MGPWQTTTTRFAELSRPLRIACLALAVVLALGLIAVVALLVFGRDPVVTFTEDFALIDAIFGLPLVLGGLLVYFGHRWITGKIKGP